MPSKTRTICQHCPVVLRSSPAVRARVLRICVHHRDRPADRTHSDSLSDVNTGNTGASGIGFAMAERAISEGMHVAIADIGAKFLPAALEKLADAAAENKVRTHAGVCDVTKEDSVRAFAAGVASKFVGGLCVMPVAVLNTMLY